MRRTLPRRLAFYVCWIAYAVSPVLAIGAVVWAWFSGVGFFGFVGAFALFWIFGFLHLFAKRGAQLLSE